MPNIVYQRWLKNLLVLLTLNGLSPFAFTLGKGRILTASTPKKLLIYSISASILVLILLISAIVYDAFFWYQRFQNEKFVFFMIVSEYCFSLAKGILLFALHNINHKTIAKLINKATKMHQMINAFTQSPTVLHERVEKIIKIKIISAVIQILISLPILYSQKILDWVIFSYPQTFAMLASAIYIFGLMILSLNCIICINSKLTDIDKRYNGLSDRISKENDIDEVSVLLSHIYELTVTHNRLYGVHLTLTLIGSMALILCALFYSINSIINLIKLVDTVGKVIDEHIYATASTVFHMIEIGSIVLVADAISKEFQEMQRLLLQCTILNSKTVKRSIEKVSIQMNLLNPNISMCGMSPIQKSMIVAICSTVVCYLTILVQFKLNQK